MKIIMGYILIVGIILFCIVTSAREYSMVFIDIESILFTAGITAGSFLILSSFGELKLLLNTIFNKSIDEVSKEDSLSLSNNLLAMKRIALSAGLIASLIGFVNMLMNIDDYSKTGPAFAFSILTCLYAIFLAELVISGFYTITVKRHDIPSKIGSCKFLLLFIVGNIGIFFAEFGVIFAQCYKAG